MSHSLQNAEKSLSVILINLVDNMKSVIKRCSHCQCEYTYYLSGFYCHIPLNDKDYCPNCKKLIIKTLDTTPKKYKCEYKEIPIDKELLSVFKKLKDKEENGQKDEFTGKAWLNDSSDSNVDECKLPPPIGKVFYREFIINC